MYRRNGIPEYLVWQVTENRIDWWELRSRAYVPLETDPQGIIKSRIFPGLWLDRAAFLRQDFPRVIAVLQQGMQTPEYRAFGDRLLA